MKQIFALVVLLFYSIGLVILFEALVVAEAGPKDERRVVLDNDMYLSFTTVRSVSWRGKRLYSLAESVDVCFLKTGELFSVPETYATDLFSIPDWAFVSSALSPNFEAPHAAVVHDWLYAVGEVGERRKADIIFLALMEETGVNRLIRAHFYTAVRLGGASSYGQPAEWRRFISEDEDGNVDTSAPFKRPDVAATAIVTCDAWQQDVR